MNARPTLACDEPGCHAAALDRVKPFKVVGGKGRKKKRNRSSSDSDTLTKPTVPVKRAASSKRRNLTDSSSGSEMEQEEVKDTCPKPTPAPRECSHVTFFLKTVTMIAILSLNVKGMRDPAKRRRVFDVCKGYDISCLQECHISSTDDLASWRAEWEGKIFASFGTSSSCGTIILLPARSPLVFSDPSFDSEGRIGSGILRGSGGGGGVRLCTVYAPNNPKSRRLFFTELYSYLTGNLPVILTGGF